MKKILIILIILMSFTIIGCSSDDKIVINKSNVIYLNNEVTLTKYINMQPVVYVSSDETIFTVNNYLGRALKEGECMLKAYSTLTNKEVENYLIQIKSNKLQKISISGINSLKVGQTAALTVETVPNNYDDTIIWQSSDESIATIRKGIIEAVSQGVVTIKAISESNNLVQDEITIYIENNETENSTIIERTYETTDSINLSSLSQSLKPIIEKNLKAIVGIKSYYSYYGRDILLYDASATIYKRKYCLENGEETDANSIFSYYLYYAIINKHILSKASKCVIYYDDKEYETELCGYDEKENIAIVCFKATDYFQTVEFGSSSDVKTGEFVISLGVTDKNNIYNSGTFGIVSQSERYIKTDTDSDGISDWDILYIQHDASVKSNASGGVLINMKGEVIALNTTTLNTESNIDNMSFAIPSDTIVRLCPYLEEGKKISRYKMGVSFTEVKTIINSESLKNQLNYDGVCEYGIYITDVDKNGLGDKSGLKINDIILSINGTDINFSYDIRKELDNAYFNNYEYIEMEVYRNGNIITLKVVF